VDAQHLILEGKEEDLEGDIEEEEEDNLLINSEKIIIKIVKMQKLIKSKNS